MIADTITGQIGEAMKARDEIRLSTLRMLSSALNYEKIAKQHDLSVDEEIVVVKKEAKKRLDAIEAYEKANALDRAEKERQELAILREFLPEEMGEEELAKILDDVFQEVNPQGMGDMGRVIGAVMGKAGNRADGKKVAEAVKARLAK